MPNLHRTAGSIFYGVWFQRVLVEVEEDKHRATGQR